MTDKNTTPTDYIVIQMVKYTGMSEDSAVAILLYGWVLVLFLVVVLAFAL